MKHKQQESQLFWGVVQHRVSRIYWRVEERTTWTRWMPFTSPSPVTAVLLHLQVSLIQSSMSSARKNRASSTKKVALLKSSHSMERSSSPSSHQWVHRRSTLFHTRRRIQCHVSSVKDCVVSMYVEHGDPKRCKRCASS